MAHTHHHGSQTSCPACDIGPFVRNHYFTGKLMLERDFSDETRFHMEKLRHHHQRLHGWGVVCGLKVKQHEQEQCRDRFVCIEPGTAIDCCGREIVVHEEECIDITQLEAIKALKKKEADDRERPPHTLQIRICYRECPTEEIPVLYDECGCDDTKCAPNRILESYYVDVIVDPPPPPDSPHAPQLAWNNSVTLLADVSRVALHEASQRLYMLVGDDVYQVDTTTPIVGPNFHLAAKGLEIAVSDNGDHLFVVTEPPAGSATNLRQLVVLKTSNMTQVRALDLDNSVNSDIRLAIASNKRLIVLVGKPGDVLIWTVAELTGTTAPPPRTPVNLAAALQDLAVASDAKQAYAVGIGNVIKVMKTAGSGTAGTDIKVLPAAAKATGIAIVRSTAPDLLAIIDHDNKNLYLVRPDPVTPNASQVFPKVSLEHPPIGLAISTGGNWAYVLERDTTAPGKSFVQAVDLFRLSQNLPVTALKSLPVGDASQHIVVSESGALLYVPYFGATANAFDGGVAKIEIKNLACEDLLWEHLNGCPHCDVPNCVVLATIKDYRVGDRIDEGKIDNRLGRRLLPSTQVLAELIECLRDHGPGGVGKQGPPGKEGPQGKDGPPGVGERGPEGPAGPGLEEGLTRIVSLSWRHNSPSPLCPITDLAGNIVNGIVIGLSNPVFIPNETPQSAADHVFQVLVQHDLLIDEGPELGRRGVICRCPVRGRILAVKPDTLTSQITSAQETTSPARGLAFVFEGDIADRIRGGVDREGRPLELWIRLRGDFVLDDVLIAGQSVSRAIDAEFARAELPTGDRPKGSKFGIQGGLFESWFQMERRG